MKNVRIVHMGEDRWLVREEGRVSGPVYQFDPIRPHRPMGYAAQREYLAPWDVIQVDEADLVPLR